MADQLATQYRLPRAHWWQLRGRPYRLYVPADQQPAETGSRDWVLALHGFLLQRAQGLERDSQLNGLAHEWHSAVAYGVGVGRNWRNLFPSQTADIDYLDSVIDAVLDRCQRLRPQPIVAGYSDGANMAHVYAAARPNRVAGVVSHGGFFSEFLRDGGINSPNKYPVLILNYEDDKLVPPWRAIGMEHQYAAEGHPTTRVQIPGRHLDSWQPEHTALMAQWWATHRAPRWQVSECTCSVLRAPEVQQ